MKKKTIIIGSLLAVFLMLMIPNVSAIEYKTVSDANSYIIKNLNITESELSKLIESFKNGNEDIEKIKNINYNLWEMFNILLNLFGIVYNLICIFIYDGDPVVHFVFLIVHILILIDWIGSD